MYESALPLRDLKAANKSLQLFLKETGSQWSNAKTHLICSHFEVPVNIIAAAFCMNCRLFIAAVDVL